MYRSDISKLTDEKNHVGQIILDPTVTLSTPYPTQFRVSSWIMREISVCFVTS